MRLTICTFNIDSPIIEKERKEKSKKKVGFLCPWATLDYLLRCEIYFQIGFEDDTLHVRLVLKSHRRKLWKQVLLILSNLLRKLLDKSNCEPLYDYRDIKQSWREEGRRVGNTTGWEGGDSKLHRSIILQNCRSILLRVLRKSVSRWKGLSRGGM